jgi:hypothetical protein
MARRASTHSRHDACAAPNGVAHINEISHVRGGLWSCSIAEVRRSTRGTDVVISAGKQVYIFSYE